MKRFLETYPFFLFLLPVFVVVHIERMYHRLIDYSLVYHEILVLLLVPVVVHVVCRLLMRSPRKTAMATLCMLLPFYFFGEIKDALKAASPGAIWQRYTLLLPLTAIMVLLCILYIRRSKSAFKRAYLFFNTGLLLFVAVDVIGMISSTKQENGQFASPLRGIDSNCTKPDIYYIIFDAYTSTAALKAHFAYDNSPIDSSLAQRGFRVIAQSQSNYNLTPFSVASTLHLDFLPDVDTTADYYLVNYMPALRLVQHNPLVPWLEKAGYRIYNHSLFSLGDHPTTVPAFDLWKLRSLYRQHNLLKKTVNDIGWQLPAWMRGNRGNVSKYAAERDRHDSIAIAHMLQTIRMPSDKPRFMYGHLLIPHDPYTFDAAGNKIADVHYPSREEDMQAYVQQIVHTNRLMVQLVDSILTKARRPVAIIIQGDHGYRFCDPSRKQPEFANFNAIYFSNKNYQWINDSLTNVNTFRVLINAWFDGRLPLLEERTHFLQYR